MGAQNVAVQEPTRLSSWVRDYHLSLALLVAGLAIVVAMTGFGFWATATGNYSFWPGLAVTVIGTTGVGLILFAGTVAYYHGWGLRQMRANT